VHIKVFDGGLIMAEIKFEIIGQSIYYLKAQKAGKRN